MYLAGHGVVAVHAPPAFVRLAAHPLRWRLLTELADSDYRVRELVTLVGEPQNLVSYHLRLLRDGGLVTAARSSFDGRDSYYHLDLDRCADALADTGAALHPALRPDAAPPHPAGRTAAVATHGRAVRVHRQQRPLTDRRGPAAPPHRRPRRAWPAPAAGPSRTCTPTPCGCCARSSASTSPASGPGTWTRWPAAGSTT